MLMRIFFSLEFFCLYNFEKNYIRVVNVYTEVLQDVKNLALNQFAA